MRFQDTPDSLPLDISGACVKFAEREALRGLDLRLAAGEVFALLGPNGAGKTTTINAILGFQPLHRGTITVSGADVGSNPHEARKHVAYIPEQVALYPNLTGIDNLRYFAALAELYPETAELHALLDEAGLPREAHTRRCGGYSKGMRQKVGIAIAVARQARLLLLDEPTSGLDPSAAADFSRIVRHAASGGTAILMATHDLYRIREMADRVGILSSGTMQQELDPRTLDHVELEELYIRNLVA